MALHKVWMIPVLEFIIICSAMVIPYFIANGHGHVYHFLPYISDSGTFAPESCIFGFLLNIGALFVALCMYLRHRQIVEYYGHLLKREGRFWRPFSTLMLWIGFICAFGIAIVANFQETRMLALHMTGALLAFSTGIFYILIQAIYQYRMTPHMASRWIAHFRLTLSIIASAAFWTMLIGAGKAGTPEFIVKPNVTEFARKYLSAYFQWGPNVTGYSGHLVSTMSEWVMCFVMQVYILSYAYELRFAKLRAPKLVLLPSSNHIIAMNSVQDSIANRNGDSCETTEALNPQT